MASFFGFFVIIIIFILLAAFRVLREYERGVVFMLGRFWRLRAGTGYYYSRHTANGSR